MLDSDHFNPICELVGFVCPITRTAMPFFLFVISPFLLLRINCYLHDTFYAKQQHCKIMRTLAAIIVLKGICIYIMGDTYISNMSAL